MKRAADLGEKSAKSWVLLGALQMRHAQRDEIGQVSEDVSDAPFAIEEYDPTGIVARPYANRLENACPNPFNPATTFKFVLPSQDFVTLKVYDVSGRLVATVLSKEMTPGEHTVRFDATGLVSGVYFYRLETSAGIQTKKMVLLQ